MSTNFYSYIIQVLGSIDYLCYFLSVSVSLNYFLVASHPHPENDRSSLERKPQLHTKPVLTPILETICCVLITSYNTLILMVSGF